VNPFKVSFTLMALIYLVLILWAVGASHYGSVGVSIVGFLVCTFGWNISDKYLS
jgi:predicted ferric reductase